MRPPLLYRASHSSPAGLAGPFDGLFPDPGSYVPCQKHRSGVNLIVESSCRKSTQRFPLTVKLRQKYLFPSGNVTQSSCATVFHL